MNILVVLALLVAPSLGMRAPYVIGGVPVAEATKYPYMVSLRRNIGENLCGGALISDQWVLTAAHCLGSPPRLAVLGAVSISGDSGAAGTVYGVMGTMRHAGYVSDGSKGNPNDIGLVKLNKTTTDTTIALSTEGDSYTGCVIMGWGHTETGILPKPTPDQLHEANVNVFSQDYCKGRWTQDQISDNHICVGVDGTAGACSTDGGGPLVCKAGDKTVLAGVMSWTSFSCGPSSPSVYTRVTKYRDWISENSCNAA